MPPKKTSNNLEDNQFDIKKGQKKILTFLKRKKGIFGLFASCLSAWGLTHHFTSTVFVIYLKASNITPLYLPLAQSDSSNCWMLRARHDKQYWGWLSANVHQQTARQLNWAPTLFLNQNPCLPRTPLSDPSTRISAVIYIHTWTHKHTTAACVLRTHGCLHPLFKHTLKRVRTEWKMHAVNFQLGLSASFLTALPSLHPNRHHFSVICRTHSFFSQSLSTAWHCLVNLFKLYGTDTQLVVGALTRKKEEKPWTPPDWCGE